MPYEGEYASKSSHHDIIKNPDVSEFLSKCDYLKEPSDSEVQSLIATFQPIPSLDQIKLPGKIVAIDGSFYEANINDHLPNTRVGYVKIGSILIDMNEFANLRQPNSHLVDPFKVAELKNNNDALTFTLPSANVRWQGKSSVREGFRAAVDAALYHPNTRFQLDDPKTSLRTTLFHLASRRSDYGTNDTGKLLLYKCPNDDCGEGPLELLDIPNTQYCSFCKREIYPSDCLRLWEKVTDYQSNIAGLSNFMMAIEHLLPIHYLRNLLENQNSISALSSLAFFIDGPLAAFDIISWLHDPIMKYLAEVNRRLIAAGYSKLVMIGLQKTGQVVDYLNLVDRYIPAGCLLPISDNFRYEYILFREQSKYGFGSSTYYGQDFIYKTSSGRLFVFALPYPFSSKSGNFIRDKTGLGFYPELPTALALINHFETDLFKNAVVPIALAHRYTAISLAPGGRVLDLLTRATFKPKT